MLAACSRSPQPTATGPTNAPEGAVSLPAAQAQPFAEQLPQIGGPVGYVGSSACRECHQKEYASWHRSYHRSMTQLISPETVRADFGNVVLTNESTRFVLTRTNQEFWVHMERPMPNLPAEVAPQWLDTRMGLVTGSHYMQVFWVPGGHGNAQIGFPFTWLIPEQRWVPRKSTFIRPPDQAHLSEVWNFTCSRCHTTAVEPRADNVHHTVDTHAAELGIACEACHGPGERHTQARLAARSTESVDPEVIRQEIVQPKNLAAARAAQVCGFCHSMKWFDNSENWQQRGFRFRPSDDLELTTPIIRPNQVDSIPGLAKYLERNPDLLLDYFWSDGMIRVSGRDYNGLIESPCYKGGNFSCLSCHSLHQSEPEGQLARNKDGDAACTQCHSQLAEPSQIAAHSRHKVGSSGSECYNCHMPRTTYGVLKAIRSHQVSSPKVEDQLATGRPNACNLCHLDKSLSWTAEYLTKWFAQPAPELPEADRDVPNAVVLALTGDAGQRALLAWHFGWEPARRISGQSWILPVLAQLLDDPYAAVRCMAQRSLRQIKPGLAPKYDFILEPNTRPSIRHLLLEQWNQQTASEPESPLPFPGGRQDFRLVQEQMDALSSRRDDRPLRLRE